MLHRKHRNSQIVKSNCTQVFFLTLPVVPVQAQSSQGNLTWMLLGVATKLLAVAELSMKRMTSYTSLPRSKVNTLAAMTC